MASKEYPDDISLRQCAESALPKNTIELLENLRALSPEEIQRMVHELHVHQIELEMQNDELRRTHEELDLSRARYFDLYDLAPVGYCTITERGIIQQANLTVTTLLGIMRRDLLRQPFSRFICKEEQDVFYLCRKQLLETGEPQSFELRMEKYDGTPFWANLQASVSRYEDSGSVLRIVLSDISARKKTEQQLTEAKEMLSEALQHNQAILDNMLDGVVTVNSQGRVECFNMAASAMFGYAPEEVLGRNISMLVLEPHSGLDANNVERFLRTGEAHNTDTPRELEALRKDGSVFPINMSMSQTSRGGQTTFTGLMRDITLSRRDENEIRRLAFYDALTGLPNRRLFTDRLEHAQSTALRTGQYGAVMFLDLDHFKQINDTLGHSVGDELLRQVAERLHSCMREGDSLARLGGDEFTVLLENLGSNSDEAAKQAEIIANKILSELGQPFYLRGNAYKGTLSIGITLFEHAGETVEDLLKKADTAMYQAKAAGRNTACFYDAAMQAAALAYIALQNDLREGLTKHEFHVCYQFQVDLEGKTIGAEALLRWQQEARGTVLPATFIPLAEETGIILPLGQWVLETACTRLAQWAKQPATALWTMAVNVSVKQFAQADFVDSVARTLKKTGANPQLLKLELTESMLLDDMDNAIERMKAIKELGVSFSLDDFGTGYSSLSYLRRLPLDQLKIDQSFVHDLSNDTNDTNDTVIIRAILSLGNNLGLKVIAEGVETESQRDILANMGCEAFQGYYFGKPC